VGGSTAAAGTSGLVRTRNNTLDDGSGNMVVAGNLTTPGNLTVAVVISLTGTATTVGISCSEPVGVFLDVAYMNLHFKEAAPTSTCTWLIMNTTGASSLEVSNTGLVRTVNNILDDGSGNVTVTSTSGSYPIQLLSPNLAVGALTSAVIGVYNTNYNSTYWQFGNGGA